MGRRKDRCLRGFFRCKWLPVFNDSVEDRIRSRSLSALAFMLIVLFVIRTVLISLLLYDEPKTLEQFASQIALESAQGSIDASFAVGDSLQRPPAVRLTDSTGGGYPNATVGLIMVPFNGSDFQNAMYNVEGTVYDYSGVVADATVSLPG